MSLEALLDSRITIWRLADGSTGVNRLGEPSKTPTISQQDIRVSFDNPRMMMSHDSGQGDRESGNTLLVAEKKARFLLNDILQVTSGSNVGSFWVVNGFPRTVQRGNHFEGYVKPYVGKTDFAA